MFQKGKVYRHKSNMDLDWYCVSEKSNRLIAIYRPGRQLGGRFVGEAFEGQFSKEDNDLWSDVTEVYDKEFGNVRED